MDRLFFALPVWLDFALLFIAPALVGVAVNKLLQKTTGGRFVPYLPAVLVVAALFTYGGQLNLKWRYDQLMASQAHSLPKTAQTMREGFPDDYHEMLLEGARLLGVVQSREKALAQGQAIGDRLKAKYANRIRNAPDELISKAITAHVVLFTEARRLGGDSSCAEALKGASTIVTERRLLPITDEATAAMWRTLIAGAKSQTPAIAAANDDDWAAADDQARELGMTEEQLETVNNSNAPDKDFCDANLLYSQAVLTLEGEAGARIRATYLTSMVAPDNDDATDI